MIGTEYNPVTGQVEIVDHGEFNPADYGEIFEDWRARLNTGEGWNWGPTAVGTTWAVSLPNATAGIQGILRQQITHSAAGTATHIYSLGATQNLSLTGGRIVIDARVRPEAATTNVTEREYWLGLMSNTTILPTHGVFIGFAGLGSPNWQGRSVVSSVATTSTSTVAAVQNNTWTTLRIEINETATSADFFVNNVSIATLSLPGTVRGMFPAFYMRSVSTAAATAYGVNQDFYRLRQYFTTPRI